MRKLEADDMFLLSEIIDKMDIKIDFTIKNQEQMGADLFMQLIRKTHKAKAEIRELIASLSGKSAEEVGKMSPSQMIGDIKEILKQDGVMDFFKSWR